jgi:hypothetical protein
MNSRREFLQIGLAAASGATPGPERIKHVIVLMLENRSFDHMLAFSGIPGTELPQPFSEVDSTGAMVPLQAVPYTPEINVDPDPDHDFEHVMYQLYGSLGGCPLWTPRDSGRVPRHSLDLLPFQPKEPLPSHIDSTQRFSAAPGTRAKLSADSEGNRYPPVRREQEAACYRQREAASQNPPPLRHLQA